MVSTLVNSSQVTKMVPEMTIKIKRNIRNTYVCVCAYMYKLLFIITASPFYFNMISPPSQPYALEKLKLSFPTQE